MTLEESDRILGAYEAQVLLLGQIKPGLVASPIGQHLIKTFRHAITDAMATEVLSEEFELARENKECQILALSQTQKIQSANV